MNSSLNHTYRLIWNERTQAYVAVAETTAGRGKRASGALLLAGLLACGGVAAQSPAALPSGGSVVAGQAQLSQNGSQLKIDQASHKLVMNWSSFDIGSQAEVKFVQPGSDSVALNRVTGGAASAIFGKLQANGQVWLVNPNGVVFGRGASVDVGGLVASSLAISDADFLAGRSRFEAGTVAGAVRNEGGLRAAEGGVVALIAPQVENSGSIQAPGGSALLGAGAAVSLDFAGDGLLSLTVERAALDAHVANSGRLSAGLVQLSAAAAGAVRASVVNNEGVIEAQGLSQQGGRIVLDGGAQGEVHVGGRLDASGGQGGRIQVTGEHIRLDGGATLDASGAAGGGQIHVGGGWQGKDASQRNATTVTAEAGVTARANAGRQGQGGEVVFWSDDATRFAGTIEVKGGSQGGDGGRAEVSGKQTLNYSGRTDARAAKGRTGDLLLDPASLEIRGGGSGSGAIGGSVVYEKDLEAQTANIVLEATNNITFKDLRATGSTDGVLDLADGVSFTAVAGRGGRMSADPGDKIGVIRFEQKNDTLRVNGNAGILLIASNWNSGGADSINGGSASVINVPHLVASGAGSNPAGALRNYDLGSATPGSVDAGTITVFGANGITIGGSVSTQGGYVRLWADADSGTGGAFTLNAPISSAGGNVYLASGHGGITMNGRIDVDSGRVFFDRETGTYPGGRGPNGPKTLAGEIHASGDLDVNTAFTMKGGASIYTDGIIRFGNVGVSLDTGTGTLTLRASGIDWGGATLNNLSTASLRLEPHDKATNMVLGDAGGFASAATLAKLPGVKNLIIGREDGTGTISVAGDFSFNASGHFEMVNKTVDITAGTLTNTGGGLTLTGDTVHISKAVTANGGTGKVTIRQMKAANELHLGTGLDSAATGQINAATLAIGRVDGGNLVFDGDISTTASSVHLMSSARVEGINGGVAAANLAITAGGGAEISNASFDFNKLALKVGGDTTIAPNRIGSFGLGTVDGLAGLEIMAGSAPTVNLRAQQTLGVNAPIKFNNSAATLNLRGAQLNAADASTQLSGQAAATISYDTPDANSLIFFGGGGLSQSSLARFNGVKKLVIGSDRNTLEAMGDLSLAVGELEIRGRELRTDHAIANQGHVRLHAQNSALALKGAVTATGSTLALSTGGGQAISASGVLTAAKLALRSNGDAALNTSSHQLGELAAEVADLKLTNGRALTVGTADGLAGVTASKTVDIRLRGAGADLVLDQAVRAGNAGNAARPLLLAAGGNFHNRAGSAALSAGGGSWEVYSADPGLDTVGGLSPDFKQYKARAGDAVLGTGNGLLYSKTAQVVVGLSGAISKVYDGNTSLTLRDEQMSVSAGIDGDIVSVKDGVAEFADKNVGNKAVHVKTATITARNGAVQVYGYEMVAESWAGDISRKTISVSGGGVTAASKVYDGNRTATVNGSAALTGLVGSDAVGANFSGSFADKNVGVGKTVLASLALTGTDAGNYQLDTQTLSLKADITPRQITAGAVTVAGKVYDGSRSATISGGTLQGLLAGDTVSGTLSGEFVDKNAGSGKDVAVTLALSGADAGNYQLAAGSQIAKGDISRKSISAGAVSVAGKVYDGNTVASVGGGALEGLVAGDTVATDLSGQFADKNVGSAKDVAVTLALKGADAGNYQLDRSSQAAKGDISRKQISAEAVTVAGKVYDGTTAATLGGGALQGLVEGDQVATSLSGEFADKNAGVGKDVAVKLALNGADAGNYQLDTGSQIAKGDISRKVISADAVSVAGKVYDGNTSATVIGGALQGLVAGDQVTTSLSGEFADKNAGVGKDVAVKLALNGADAGNYQLDTGSQIAKGDISRKVISADAVSVAAKVYDGSKSATVSGGALQGLVAGDQVTMSLSGEFADKNAGLAKDVAVKLALNGADAGNYQLDAGSRTAKGDITQRLLTAEHIAVAGKVYDGNSEAEVREIRVAGVLPGDQLLVAAQGRFADPSAGRDKPVSISAVQLSGADAANYRIDSSGLRTQASIDAPPASDARTSVLVKPQHGNGTQAASSAVTAAAGPSGADAGVVGELVSGGTNAGFNTEQALYGAGQYSIAVDAPALEQPLRADVPVFSQRAAAQPESLGRYLLTDLGDSLAVLPGSQAPTPLPEQAAGLRYSGEAMLLLSARQTGVLRLSFDAAGGLRVEVPAAVAALGHEVLSAYALSALKRDAGIGLDQVRTVVLHYGSV
ncbi:YDG domain-containing protein [Paucibacter sp. XJ19-41]|uniref:YDG domain-containing protein n=1 Tax=Paucibacter sp. XJ19-41 TaxID=2927824 RepID=UPI00234BE4DA|nr:YDG domain-containing protein [Paucibacter sp. XJ19-41]MDC6167116.1 YDG domain-containing protein [Paucibacter sp. XJ19-41]